MRRLFVEKVLDDFEKERVETWPQKCARCTFLSLENAPTHRADNDFDRLGTTKLSHPLYRQDVPQCDFWLFGNLKIKLEGNTFTNATERMAKVNVILTDIP
jgi:hypothetical protein